MKSKSKGKRQKAKGKVIQRELSERRNEKQIKRQMAKVKSQK